MCSGCTDFELRLGGEHQKVSHVAAVNYSLCAHMNGAQAKLRGHFTARMQNMTGSRLASLLLLSADESPRGALSLCFYLPFRFIYETEHFNGVAELLEILGRFVSELVQAHSEACVTPTRVCARTTCAELLRSMRRPALHCNRKMSRGRG